MAVNIIYSQDTMVVYDPIAEFYDLETAASFPHELEFWQEILDEYGSPVLELGCGTGRLTIPLAEHGHCIVGLDISTEMLTIAERKKSSLSSSVKARFEFVKGDMADFDLGREFNVIFIPFNSFAMLIRRAQQESCLRCVYRHLMPEDVLALTLPAAWRQLENDDGEHISWVKYNPDSGKVMARIDQVSTDLQRLVITNEVTYREYLNDGNVREVNTILKTRILFQPEVELLLGKNGFIIDATYGAYDRRPSDAASPEQIIVAHRTTNAA